jgi:hypothetical protein
MITPFWSSEPTILLNKDYILQMWPLISMNIESKLNAISRLVIVLTILGFLVTFNIKFIIMGILTLALIYFIYRSRKQAIIKELINSKEGFTNSIATTTNPVTLDSVLKTNFYHTNKKNPLSNVLLTDIMDNPHRKAAPPAFNPDVYEDINESTKKTIQYLNPEIKNTTKQLFSDLGQKFEFDQSMRNFYSMPNTRVTNDQGSFAKYLYGDMPSCKDGDPFACLQDNERYILM